MTGPHILLQYIFNFQTIQTVRSNSTIRWTTTSDKWDHELQIVTFDKKYKTPNAYNSGPTGLQWANN